VCDEDGQWHWGQGSWFRTGSHGEKEICEMMSKRQAAILGVSLGAGVVLLALAGGPRPAVAEAPPGRYQIASEEILDTQTGLVWQRVSSAATMSWADAQAYCGGAWRVPSMKELQTLVDETRTGPAIDTTAFADVSATSGYDYWSSSPVAGLSVVAWWYVEFNSGLNSYGAPADTARIRCVR
jgi:hypothetical protein